MRTLGESFLATGRLDSEYYQNKYDEIERVIRNYRGGCFHISLNEIKDKNFNPNNDQQYRYIELANIGANGNISEPIVDFGENLPTRARRIVKTGDMIMSSVEGSLQSCALITDEFNDCIVSTGFYVLKSLNLNSETLLVLFKSKLFQEYLHKFPSGTILTAISKDELQNILIPKIAEQTQTQIADLLKQSFTLRQSANELLQTAKQKVETAIEQG
ncbi:MAG: restriction endonuclease subunit S [Neisseriaceae bacterium]|nr:restriction endonuclease subunit S [Neisseriaceae bacterium]